MDLTLLGMVTDVNPLQLRKADLPIDVTLLGMATDFNPLQPSKDEPIDVTLLGMVTEVSPLQAEYLQIALYQRFAS